MLANSRNLAISGGKFTNVNVERLEVHGGGGTAFDKLQRATAHCAFHNSAERFDSPKCHPNTRTAVQHRLLQWIMGHAERDALIMWLYGAAGAGKSAIAQTIAERCYTLGLVLASFFFSRLDSSRSHAASLVATLTYQIARAFPDARNALERVVDRDPLIFKQSLEEQVLMLIIQPLQPLIASGFFDNPETSPRLIIIDGLDECADSKVQSNLLHIIADVLQKHELPLIFLIASRPEPIISYTLNLPKFSDLRASIPLSDRLDSEDDIRRFVEDSFVDIIATHPRRHLIPDSWPPASAVNTLINKSSGQFIFAAVAMKYIASVDDQPTRCLDVILGLCPPRREMPFAELDALYAYILSSATYSEEAVSIISYHFLSPKDYTIKCHIRFMEIFLGLGDGDVEMFLGDLMALVSIVDGSVHILHASLRDFFFDQSRSGRFYINCSVMHAKYVKCFCELVLSNPPGVTHKLKYLDKFSYHLPLAALNTQLLEHIAKCSPPDLLRFFDPSPFPDVDLITGVLPEYLKAIQALNFPDAQQLYQHHLATYYQLLRERMNHIAKPEAMLLLTLTVSGADDLYWWWRGVYRAIPEIDDELNYPFSPDNYEASTAKELLISFFQDPSLSHHHAMTVVTYRTAAALCLKLLCDRRLFSLSPPHTSHNTQSRRIKPWRWNRLVKTNRHFFIRKQMAKQEFSYGSPMKHPFPNLLSKFDKNRGKRVRFRTLLDGLPELLRRSDKSSDLKAYRYRAFTNMALKYPRSTKRARKALKLYSSSPRR